MRHNYEVHLFYSYHNIGTCLLTLPEQQSQVRRELKKKVLLILTFEGYTCSMGWVGIAFNKVPPSLKIAAANLNK